MNIFKGWQKQRVAAGATAEDMNVSTEPKNRCFVALECPADWKEELGLLQANLQRTLQGRCFRWTKPDQMHLTIRFFGSITDQVVEEIKQALLEVPNQFVAEEPVLLEAQQLGCFPRPNAPRVLWLGLEAPPELVQLHKIVTRETVTFGSPPESRPYKPHLTLARIQEPSCVEVEKVQMALNSLSTWSAGPWEVRELTLFKSQLSPAGANYTKLLEVPL